MSPMQLTPGQRRAALDKARVNTALTSGAGCGKTAVLAHRFAHLLLNWSGEDDPLAGLVALTFTDKAALEMRQRLAELLGEIASSGGEDHRKVRGWVERLPEARIMTIHSFCASLLRVHAISAGVDPGFVVLADELVTRQMTAEAAEQATASAVESGEIAAARLVAELGFDETVREVAKLVASRLEWDAAACADPEKTLARWSGLAQADAEAAWNALACDTDLAAELEELTSAPCSDPDDELAKWRDEKLAIAQNIISGPADRTVENFRAIAESPGNLGAAASWGGKGCATAMRHRLRDFLDRLAQWSIYTEGLNELDRAAADSLACLTSLAESAKERFEAAKRARGALDFVDLLEQAGALLKSDPKLRSRISGQISQLLIDECQDTNAFQLKMLVGLASDGGDDCPQGKLCLIGDAKQSIYRFRGAEANVFVDLCDRLGPGGRENLDVSFRTHAGGVAFVNALFGPLMGEAYEEIHAHRRQTPPQPSVEIVLAGAEDGEEIDLAATACALQAGATAQRIREMIDNQERLVWDRGSGQFRAAAYGDIAILFARMTQSLDYERQLAARGIPYYVVAGTGFFRQQEIYDVLNALRIIDNPFDDGALVGLLRSGIVGLEDNSLMHLAESTAAPHAVNFRPEQLAGRVAAGELAAMSAGIEMVRRLHRQKDSLGLDGLIEAILSETGYEASLIAQPFAARKIGNVRMLIERARSAWREGMTLSNFITQMNAFTLSESRYEQAAVAGEEDNVVRLMTVHKAKGLEFPIVFVPDLNTSTGQSHTARVLRRADWGLTCRLTGDEDDQADRPLSHRLAKLREDADEQAETIRKYYVALTRHEDHLVLVGADWRDRQGRLKQAGSFIRQVDEVLALSQGLAGGKERGEIGYGDGYVAVCRLMRPTPADRRGGDTPAGKKMLTEASDAVRLVAKIGETADSSAPAPPLLGRLPLEVGRAELAVTALGDFAACPMLYQWRHELRIPAGAAGDEAVCSSTGIAAQQAGPYGSVGIDAAAAGTFFHRCVELLDFAQPQPASVLASQAAEEVSLPADLVEELTAALTEMLSRFSRHELWGQISEAGQTLRELDFLLKVGPATLRGQIDLLLCGPEGVWRVVDYKSDKLADESKCGLAEHSLHHRLQMLIYAMAAGRHLQGPAPQATLYYLRPAASHTFLFDEAALSAGEDELTTLLKSLIAARRSGQFEKRRSENCQFCGYAALCERFGQGGN